MDRLEKQNVVSQLNSSVSDAEAVVVVHYRGLSVVNMEGIRSKAYDLGVRFKVVKNTLARRAMQNTVHDGVTRFLNGPTAIVWGKDPLSCAKLVLGSAKEYDALKIVGGTYSGIELSAQDVINLASLPSLEELRGKLVGLVVAPATRLVVLTKTPAASLVGIAAAYGAKG